MTQFKLAVVNENPANYKATKKLKTILALTGFYVYQEDTDNEDFCYLTLVRFEVTGKRKDYSNTIDKLLLELEPTDEFEYNTVFVHKNSVCRFLCDLDSDNLEDAHNEAIRILKS